MAHLNGNRSDASEASRVRGAGVMAESIDRIVRAGCMAAMGACAITHASVASSQELLATPLATAFGSHADIRNVRLSPDGERVSLLRTHPDGMTVVYTLDFLTRTSSFVVAGEADDFDITWCDWANDERMVCALMMTDELVERYFRPNRLISVRPDGTDLQPLLRSIDIRESIDASRVVDWLVDEPQHILVDAGIAGYRKVDVESGATVTESGQRGVDLRGQGLDGFLVTDGSGVFRLLARTPTPFDRDWYVRETAGSEWSLLDSGPFVDLDSRFFPVGFGENLDELIALREGRISDGREASAQLVSIDLANERRESVLLEHPRIELPVSLSFGKRERLVAVGYAEEVPKLHYVDSVARSIGDRIRSQFPGRTVWVLDEDWQRRYYIVMMAAQGKPGAYYRFDSRDGILVDIGGSHSRLAEMTLAEVERFEFTARDGATVPAYLTLPRAEDRETPPLVVLTRSEPLVR